MMKEKKIDNKNVIRKEVTIRCSAAEYLTFVAATGDNPDSIEMQENSVIKYYLITAKDGKQYKTKHYNLQAIIGQCRKNLNRDNKAVC